MPRPREGGSVILTVLILRAILTTIDDLLNGGGGKDVPQSTSYDHSHKAEGLVPKGRDTPHYFDSLEMLHESHTSSEPSAVQADEYGTVVRMLPLA